MSVPHQPQKLLEIIFLRPERPKSNTLMNVSQIQQEQTERIFSRTRFREKSFMLRRRSLSETLILTVMRFGHDLFMGHQQNGFSL